METGPFPLQSSDDWTKELVTQMSKLDVRTELHTIPEKKVFISVEDDERKGGEAGHTKL